MRLYHFTTTSLLEMTERNGALQPRHSLHPNSINNQAIHWLSADPDPAKQDFTLLNQQLNDEYSTGIRGTDTRTTVATGDSLIRITLSIDETDPQLISFVDYCNQNEAPLYAKRQGVLAAYNLTGMRKHTRNALMFTGATKERAWYLYYGEIKKTKFERVELETSSGFELYTTTPDALPKFDHSIAPITMSSTTSLQTTFDAYFSQAESVWEIYWNSLLATTTKTSWDYRALTEYKRMTIGGKHLRSSLALLGYELANKPIDVEILLASMSVEALHSAFLVHDDIVDKSDTRRNEPTVHIRYEREAIAAGRDQEAARDIGYATALHIGDIGQALAQQILLDSNFSSAALLSCIRLFNENLWHTVMGQLQDMQQINIEDLREQDVEDIHKKKTAYYSFVLPLLVGYTLGEGDPTQINALSDYAIKVGTVYQMQDDVLGIYGNEEELGKPVDTDIKEGKKTLLICRSLAVLNGDLRAELLRYYGNENITPDQVKRVGDIIRQCGALDYSDDKANRLINEALLSIQNLRIGQEQLNTLRAIAHYVGTRKY